MVKKIIHIFVCCLLFCYALFVGYQYYTNSNSLNDLIQMRTTLQKDIKLSENKIEGLKTTLTSIQTEKEEIKTQIIEQETAISQTVSKVNAKQAAIAAERARRNAALIKAKISSGDGSKWAYLTFDDGPSGYTGRVLDILQEYGIKATFFVNGRTDANSLNIYRRIVNEGHAIGNHTYSHQYVNIYSSVNGFDNDFNSLQNLILNTTGVTMDIMRFPGGSNNGVSNSYSSGIMNLLTSRYRDLGYAYFDWNSSAGDTGAGATTTSVINNVTNQCYNKDYAIILMHDSKGTTPGALPTIIHNLTNLGFKFDKLSNSTPAIQFK